MHLREPVIEKLKRVNFKVELLIESQSTISLIKMGSSIDTVNTLAKGIPL